MKILGFEIRRRAPEQKGAQFETVLERLLAARYGGGEYNVTPENCMRSPTVQAIVTAVSRRLAVTPVHVYERKMVAGRETKRRLPDHPVSKLLAYPNRYQSRVNFWQDATSAFVRWGNFYAYKGQGSTGPIRFLTPIHPGAVTVEQDEASGALRYRVSETGGMREYTSAKIMHARGPARNFYLGDSPVRDVAQAIALEILAEEFGAAFFQNGALPLLIFKIMAGSAGFKDKDTEQRFIKDFQEALSGNKRHRAMLLPKGIESADPVPIENNRAQFLETRKYQRTVIAGAFGVPPHLVGDLERATFNNVEQQDQDFTLNVVMPVAQAFEAAMERDLLTDADWNRGIAIRFNLDSILRADFKSRQEGLQVQRNNGIISANEWREIEGRNPLPSGKGGDDYMRPANMMVAGEEPEEPEPPEGPEPELEPEDEEET